MATCIERKLFIDKVEVGLINHNEDTNELTPLDIAAEINGAIVDIGPLVDKKVRLTEG